MRSLILTILSLIAGSCVDPIEFDVPNDQNYLVVDGFITNETGPHRIRLTRSSAYADVFDGGLNEPISGASVSIIDGDGTIVQLTEVSNGTYETNAQFTGEVGERYLLQIEVEGQIYRSTAETLQPPGNITNITYKYVTKPFINEFNNTEDNWGIEFYADVDLIPGVQIYKWDYEEDYEFLQILFNEEEDPTMPDTCYVYETVLGYINLLNNNSNQSSYSNYAVSFVPVNYKFNNKYSMNLIQYSMSEQAAAFWEKIESQTNISGSIFDPTPSRIRGNIRNVNDDNEEVLGYFGAFGKTTKRVFLTNFDITILLDLDVIFHDDLDICTIGGAPPPNYCFGCMFFPGSQTQKPDFWE